MNQEDTETQQIIVFNLEDNLYGVNIGQVREITRVGKISPVPNSPDYIEGVTNLRGQVTTVIDMRKRLDMPQKELDKDSRMMVTELEGRSVGMIVDSVTDVTKLPKADIEETPELATAAQNK